LISGKIIDFYISDAEKENFYRIVPFLKEKNILDCRTGTGSTISAEGTYVKNTIYPLPGLKEVIKNPEFKEK